MLTKEKYLIFGIASLHPKKYPVQLWQNREKDYFLSLQSLLNLNLNIDLYVFDNSIDNIDKISNRGLRLALYEQVIDYPVLIPKFVGLPHLYNENNDKGYLQLLTETAQTINKYASNNSFITIVNLRRYFLSSNWFNLVDKVIVQNNNDILVVSNKQVELNSMNIFQSNDDIPINDFIFTMKIELFMSYIEFIKNFNFTDNLKSHGILWQFIQGKKFQIAENVGIMRNEWDINKQDFTLSNLFFS